MTETLPCDLVSVSRQKVLGHAPLWIHWQNTIICLMKTTDIQNVLWNLFWLCLMELLWAVNEIFVTVQVLPNSSFRSRNTTQAGKRKDPGFHPISESSRQESGVLWWSLHSEAGLWFWWNYRIKWQLQGLAKWEARVEEVHRGASPNVLICQWQVRNHNAFLCGPNDGKMHSKTPSVCEYSHRWALLKKRKCVFLYNTNDLYLKVG